MEQFRQIGEVVGSVKALMVFKDEIRINRSQCLLLVDALHWAFDAVGKEIRENLRFEERNVKWKLLQHPLRELLRIFRGSELYLRCCMDSGGSWWVKAISLHQNNDCVGFHLHNLLWCLPVVFEAVEAVSEVSGNEDDDDDIGRRKILVSKKYDKEFLDPKLFQLKFGKRYLISREMERRLVTSSKEDRWALEEAIREKRRSQKLTTQERRLAEILTCPTGKLFPTTVLAGSKEYVVKRRLGSGSHYKEIQWMGEGFAVRHFFGDIEPLVPEISQLSSLSHPNVMHFLCSFSDEERKECFLLMDLMSRDLGSHVGEMSSPRRKVPFPLPIAVDIMLQIARGMEYLHSRRITHGNLNPSDILVRSRGSDGYLHVKISGFGRLIRSARTGSSSSPLIWSAPEVLVEKDQVVAPCDSRLTEKSDVYSFAMICFELLTGKVPFEDVHMQGEKMSRNVRAGERPLFPFPSPKYLTNLTKRCWQADPSQRPSFVSICRILRYIKRFLLLNPDHHSGKPDSPVPVVDYFELEASLCRRFPAWKKNADEEEEREDSVSRIPFEMFAYKVMEREKTGVKDNRSSESGSEETSLCGDDHPVLLFLPDQLDPLPPPPPPRVSPPRPFSESTKKVQARKLPNGRSIRLSGQTQRGRVRPPQKSSPCSPSRRINFEHRIPSAQRTASGPRSSGHASD